MKRYIRSSYSPSMPDWLSSTFKRRFGGNNMQYKLTKNLKLALDRVNFLDHKPNGRSLAIYLLATDYGSEPYAPGINDSDTALFNGRQRKFGSLAKSSLLDRAVDVVWIDLDDPNNFYETKEKYRDPRYTYRYDSKKGSYAGQYMRKNYIGDGKYEDAGWSEKGMTPANESRARDKSGYEVPSPEEKIRKYYEMFPEKVTDKVDDVYNRIVDVRQELMDIDFNSAFDRRSEDYLRRAYSFLADVIYDYRRMLGELDENRQLRKVDEFRLSDFSRSITAIKSRLDDIEELIDKIQ